MSGTAVSIVNRATTVLSYCVDAFKLRPYITGGLNSDNIPLTDQPCGLYVRRDRKNRRRLINVFDHNGIKCYTIERGTQFSPIWRILESPSRKEVATIHAGLNKRTVDFHNKKDMQHRVLKHKLGKLGRRFYLTDGAVYTWSRSGKYLEKIINPGGGDEEVHERLAKARLMRQFRFDYELLYDYGKIDREVVLATAFISMVTEWGLGGKVETRGPTIMRKNFIAHISELPEPVPQPIPSGRQPEVFDEGDEDCACLDKQPHPPTPIPLDEPPQSVENRVFLIVERPDGTRSSPLEITQSSDQYDNPLLQLTDAPEPDFIRHQPTHEAES